MSPQIVLPSLVRAALEHLKAQLIAKSKRRRPSR
jgi:hypothetical protein